MSKSDPQRLPDYLGHILEAILRIERYTEDMTELMFLDDEKTQDAVIRNLEIVGEACKNIERYHPDFAAAHPEVPWGDAYLLRNQVSHGYFRVDLEIVWRTLQNDLPLLAQQIQALLNE
ncbi:MAG: DUF86 domain-containing protein [Burkholderiaceae bacterium]|nr:MAG: DUF86 domain-containing protein [Burkholderiaceae bacterium]